MSVASTHFIHSRTAASTSSFMHSHTPSHTTRTSSSLSTTTRFAHVFSSLTTRRTARTTSSSFIHARPSFSITTRTNATFTPTAPSTAPHASASCFSTSASVIIASCTTPHTHHNTSTFSLFVRIVFTKNT